MSKVPKSADADVIREALLSALERHSEELQGHEYLLSEKSSNYALIKQTKGLRDHDDAPASLLRYHDLKNTLLGPASSLSAEQKKIISELVEKKDLTLKMLENLVEDRDMIARELMTLQKAGLLEPDLCARAFKHKDQYIAVRSLVRLYEADLFKPDLCTAVLRHENPVTAAIALETLNEEGLLESDVWTRVLEHKTPEYAALAMVRLNKAGLLKLKPDFCTIALECEEPDEMAQALVQLKQHKLDTPDNLSLVSKQKNPFSASLIICLLSRRHMLMSDVMLNQIFAQKSPARVYPALDILNEAGMLKVNLPDLYTGVIKHEEPEKMAQALVELKQHKLDTPGNCSLVLEHKDPVMAARDLVDLDSKDWVVDKESEKSSALERHLEARQGHENLLSAKGNNHELIKQTRGLRKYGDAPASLLRYHDLKNTLLGPASSLSAEQKKIISELVEKKDLTLKMLENLVEDLDIIAVELMKLQKAGLLEPDLCARAFKHKDQYGAVRSLVRLYEDDLFKPDLCTAVLRHENPLNAALAMIKLNKTGLLKLKPDFCTIALEHEKPEKMAQALVELKQHKLDTPGNCSLVLKHKNPVMAARDLVDMDSKDWVVV